METGAQRESEALRRAFKIRLNDTCNAQQNADETHLASVAQVRKYSELNTTLVLGRLSECRFGMPRKAV